MILLFHFEYGSKSGPRWVDEMATWAFAAFFLALDTFLLSVLINLIYYYYRNEEGKETYQGQQRL